MQVPLGSQHTTRPATKSSTSWALTQHRQVDEAVRVQMAARAALAERNIKAVPQPHQLSRSDRVTTLEAQKQVIQQMEDQQRELTRTIQEAQSLNTAALQEAVGTLGKQLVDQNQANQEGMRTMLMELATMIQEKKP